VSERVTVIGAGAMGGAVVSALAASGTVPAASIVVSEIDDARREAVVAASGASAGEGLPQDVANARALVLAVKPQSFPEVAEVLRPALAPSPLVISIMAGVRLETMEAGLDTARVVRAMPNTPAQIGRGTTVWIAGRGVDAADRRLTQQILGSFGTEIEVHAEGMLDAATAVHGSGPAYVYLVAEAWIDAAVSVGLDREIATSLVRETLIGSAELWNAGDLSAEALRQAVTSPGGTTAAALDVFEERDLRGAFLAAVAAAYRRSQELG